VIRKMLVVAREKRTYMDASIELVGICLCAILMIVPKTVCNFNACMGRLVPQARSIDRLIVLIKGID
jgi:hypothetical protein